MAELKLRVSLDTSYLKGQISRLPLEFAGANVSIRPKFDRQTIVNEFRLLNRYISSKKFNIVINTNLNKEIENADRLVKALGRVQQAASGAKGGLPIGTQVLSRTKSKGGFAAAEIKTLFGAAVQGGLIDEKTLAATRAQMVAALGSIGRDSIAGLLNGLKSGDADIQNAAKFLGNNLITSFKTVLGIASPSREFKKIGESAGQGFEQGLLKSIEIAEQSATRKMQRMLDRLARMALMMGGISGPEIGRQIAQARALPALNFGATTPRTSVAIGPSSTGRSLPPGASRPELTGTAFGRQKYLPTALGEELKEVLRGAANAFLDSIRQNIRAVTVTDMGAPPSRQGLLQGGSVAGFLPGRPSAASVLELNNILAGAIREYFKSVAREIEYRSGSIGKAPISTTPLLAQSRVAGLLPQSVGRTPSVYRSGPRESQEQLFARRTREAYINSAARAADIRQSPLALPPGMGLGQPSMMRAPSVPPSMGGGAPPVPPRGGGGGSFGGGGFNVPNLPGAGLVREIGTEFGFAAKQVLLFGTAYKALAFIQGFPAQVGDAVGALQSFRNTLGAISPSAEEAAESSQFILDIVDKYNTPIQSARDGFTKLYASMKPTGFSGDEIRDLFLGISQAAATFGMSAEKVDRVNYAFAQMASKGQVMSEELKGQLGDVLPGAMGIFAEAAGFTGPDAITKFSKALEDGAYKGAAMKTLLTNVGIVMRKEFGPGAEGAARTFQGVINRMQNSFKLLYESFEPVAVGFLNSVVMPLTSGIKTVTDGFNAFFTGQAAQTAGGSVFAKQLELLRPTFEGIAANIKQVLPLLQSFANTALSLGQVLLQIAGNPFAGYLARIYLSVLPLTVALRVLNLQVLIPLIGSFLRAIPAFISFNAAMISGTSANKGLQLAMQLTGQTAGVTAGKIRLVGAALATLGTTAILAGIGLLIERFLMMKSAIDGVRQSTQQMLGSISGMANTGAVKELQNVSRNIQKQKDTFAELKKFVSGGRLGGGSKALTPEMAAKFEEVGMGSFVSKNLFGKPMIADFLRATEIIDARLQGLNKESSSVAEKLPLAVKVAADIAKRAKTAETIAPIPPAGTKGGATDSTKSKQERESQVPLLKLELQYQKELLPLESEINRARLLDNNLTVIRLEGEKNILDLKYEASRINLEDIPVAEKRLKIETLQAKGQMSALKTRYDIEFEIAKILEEHDKTLESMEEKSNLELLNRKSYIELLLNGIKPAHAKITIEVENEIAALTKSLELRRLNLEEEIKLLQAKKAGGGTIDEDRLAELQSGLGNTKQRLADLPAFGTGETARRLAIADAPKLSQEYTAEGLEAAQDRLEELMNTGYQVVQAANAIGDAFGEAFKGVITGSMTAREALAGFFQGIADYFADMVAQMIAAWLRAQLIKGFQALFGAVLPGLGAAAGGGLSNLSAPASINNPLGDLTGIGGAYQFANGGIAPGGFRAFADGGIVSGPTLGLVGEGKYNEAVIPLPDGKSVPVQLSGGDGGNQINSNITVNVSNGQAQSNATGSNSSELGRKIEGAVKQVIVGELRPGGLLASR